MVPNMSTHPFYIRNPAKVSERTQEDAHELFGLLIENIEREHFLIKNLSFKVNSVISCCGKNCNHQVDKNLTETNLSLPITKSDLGAIIDDYLSDEIINDSTCDTCNKEHCKETLEQSFGTFTSWNRFYLTEDALGSLGIMLRLENTREIGLKWMIEV